LNNLLKKVLPEAAKGGDKGKGGKGGKGRKGTKKRKLKYIGNC